MAAALFYRVTVEHMGVKLAEVQRGTGMEQLMMGNVALARVFYDPEVAERIGDAVKTLVCQTCALEPNMLARLAESYDKTSGDQD